MSKQETPEQTIERLRAVLAIANRKEGIRRQISETKRQMKDLVAAKREDLRRQENELKLADDEWASPVIQGELF